jgi:16S rRNA (cytidine1402-2'-O)-methyltransferase
VSTGGAASGPKGRDRVSRAPSERAYREQGKLVLVATPIGNLGDLSPRAEAELRAADLIAAEDTRRTRALLTHAGISAGRRLRSVHAHNERQRAAELVEEIRRGRRVAFATDAGTPGISDPGERLVRTCLEAGLAVEAVPGPSALLAALVVSGLPTDRFVFEGFLPRKGTERKARLAGLATEPRTVVWFEAPHRLPETLAALAAACGPERRVAVARELTKLHEEVWRGTLGDAAAHFAGVAPRGEHVVVVGGAPEPSGEVDDTVLTVALRAALDRGASARDAAAEVAAELHVPKRRAYQLAVAVRDASS